MFYVGNLEITTTRQFKLGKHFKWIQEMTWNVFTWVLKWSSPHWRRKKNTTTTTSSLFIVFNPLEWKRGTIADNDDWNAQKHEFIERENKKCTTEIFYKTHFDQQKSIDSRFQNKILFLMKLLLNRMNLSLNVFFNANKL